MSKRSNKFTHDKDTKIDYRTVVGVQESEFTNELILTDSDTVTWDTSQVGKAIAHATATGGTDTGITQLTGDVTAGPGNGSQAATITPYDLLDGTKHQDTTASSVTKGDLIYGNSTPEWDDLPIGTENQVLTSVSGLPTWQTVNIPPAPTQQNPRRYCSTNVGTSPGHLVMTGCPFQNGSFTVTTAGNTPARTLNDYTHSNVATTIALNNQAYWDSRSTNLGPSFRHRMTMRMIIDVTDSAGTDNVKYRFYGGLIETQAGTGPMGLTTCAAGPNTWNGGGTWDAAYICWEKASQANIMVCGGETSAGTTLCADTGVAAPASDTKIDIFLDHRDGSKITGLINGVAFSNDETTRLPATSSNSQIGTQIGLTNTVAPSAANAIILRVYLLEYTWQ